MNTSSVAFLALLLAAPAAAQTGAPALGGVGVTFGDDHFSTLPGSFGRCVSGELTGDLRVDAVQLIGGQPVLVYGPGLFRTLVDYPFPANDACVLPGAASAGHDALALVSSRGLELWQLQPAGGFTTANLGSSIWNDAQAVRAADIDGSGVLDLVGLSADGQTLVRILDPGTVGIEKTLDVPGTIHAMTLLDWDGGAGIELAALTTVGFYVIDYNGNVVFSGPGGSATDVLITLPGPGYDRLVCATKVGSSDALVVRDQSGMEAPVTLGSVDVVGLAVGDLNLDGLPDLVLGQRASKDLIAFTNRGVAGATFGTAAGDYQVVPIDDSGPAPDNGAWPCLLDADQDGDLDLLAPIESLSALHLRRNGKLDDQDAAPTLVAGVYDYDETDSTGELTLTVAPPVSSGFLANAIQVVLWRQASPSAATATSALAHTIVPYAGTGNAEVTVGLNDPIDSYSIHDVEVRFVEVDGGNEIQRASGTRNFATATRISGLNYFASLHGVAPASLKPLALNGYTYQGNGVSDIGVGVAPLGEIPDFSDGFLPDPWL